MTDRADSDIPALLANGSLRLTRPRRLIWRHLAAAGAHASAEGIYQALRRGRAPLGRATVFRTLKLFARLGIAASTDAAAPLEAELTYLLEIRAGRRTGSHRFKTLPLTPSEH